MVEILWVVTKLIRWTNLHRPRIHRGKIRGSITLIMSFFFHLPPPCVAPMARRVSSTYEREGIRYGASDRDGCTHPRSGIRKALMCYEPPR